MPPFSVEPSREDWDWYTERSSYIGFHKPSVEHVKDEPLSYTSEHEARCAEGDYMLMDDQGFDKYKE